MKITVEAKGFRELERVLAEELPKATARNTLRRTAINALQPIERRAKEHVPVDEGELRDSIKTKSVRASRTSRTRFARSSGVEVATGPTGRQEGGGKAGWQEFGTVKQPAQPYMRPAADAEGEAAVESVREELTRQIERAKARIARKAARVGK